MCVSPDQQCCCSITNILILVAGSLKDLYVNMRMLRTSIHPTFFLSGRISLLFIYREFFRTFLPKDVDHIAKNRKMVNCGVVAFDLVKG